MHASAPSECHESELARIESAIERNQLERIHHIVVGNPDDPARGFVRLHFKLVSDRGDRFLDRSHVRLDLPSAEIFGIDSSEPKIRVGRRGLRPSLSVSGGPGNRACGLRPHVQLSEIVHPRDRAAAIAYFNEIDDGNHDRVA